jgi:putative acetyltransferase
MQLYDHVVPIREASRQVVRELGFLEKHLPSLGVTHSQCHVLIELDHHGMLTTKELSDILNLDKSTMSRTVDLLIQSRLIETRADGSDRRRKQLSLASQGKQKVKSIHTFANQQVQEALELLNEDQRNEVQLGMRLYAKALTRLRKQEEFVIRKIKGADNPSVAKIIRKVMPAYGAEGPGFALGDPEVADMYSAYHKKGALFLVVERKGSIVGGGGFDKLVGGPKGVCELRKMYFLPEARGLGVGRRLLDKICNEAKKAGYKKCYLETLSHMSHARHLYENCGFSQLDHALGKTGHFGCNAWYLKTL